MLIEQLKELEACLEDSVIEDPEYFIDSYRFVVEIRTTTENMAVEEVEVSAVDLARLKALYLNHCIRDNPVFQELYNSLDSIYGEAQNES